mgnify:CR=1 FL=1
MLNDCCFGASLVSPGLAPGDEGRDGSETCVGDWSRGDSSLLPSQNAECYISTSCDQHPLGQQATDRPQGLFRKAPVFPSKDSSYRSVAIGDGVSCASLKQHQHWPFWLTHPAGVSPCRGDLALKLKLRCNMSDLLNLVIIIVDFVFDVI